MKIKKSNMKAAVRTLLLNVTIITTIWIVIFVPVKRIYAEELEIKEEIAKIVEDNKKDREDIKLLFEKTNIKPKMIRPNKEIEFLFHSIIGNSFTPGLEERDDFKFNDHFILTLKNINPFAIWKEGSTQIFYSDRLMIPIPVIKKQTVEKAEKEGTNDDKARIIAKEAEKQLDNFINHSKEYQLADEKIVDNIVAKIMAGLIDYLDKCTDSECQLSMEKVNALIKESVGETFLVSEIVREVSLTDSQSMEYKMKAVEHVLGLRTQETNSNSKITERIERAHNEIKNYDWFCDHLRFGLMMSHIPKSNANVTSLVLNAYPSYHRFMPGTFDLVRRMSFFIGGGTGIAPDDIEMKGIVYSAGLGVDVVKGVGLAFGWSIYSVKEDSDKKYETENAFTFGISLNAELWKGLFGK